MRFIRTFGLAMTILTLMQASAIAGVIIGGTRIIFDGAKKESSISVNNPDTTPYLIQSWIDERDGGAGKTPFIITPPLYRLDSGQKNIERIVATGSLPQTQDSLFWVNIKAIHSASKQINSLQIAVQTRIKLIYSHVTLRGSTLAQVSYVLPASTARFPLPEGAAGNALTFKIINDYGSPGASHQANL